MDFDGLKIVFQEFWSWTKRDFFHIVVKGESIDFSLYDLMFYILIITFTMTIIFEFIFSDKK